jgi:hypothetical protein
MNGGTANTEKIIVQATLGNTASPCVTTPGFPALGAIVGTLTFSITGSANNCATIFSGVTLPAPAAASKFKMTWTTPEGSNPTNWTQPTPFKVTGAANSSGITIKHGTVAGVLYADGTPQGDTFRLDLCQELAGRSRLGAHQRADWGA